MESTDLQRYFIQVPLVSRGGVGIRVCASRLPPSPPDDSQQSLARLNYFPRAANNLQTKKTRVHRHKFTKRNPHPIQCYLPKLQNTQESKNQHKGQRPALCMQVPQFPAQSTQLLLYSPRPFNGLGLLSSHFLLIILIFSMR
jgi:hypothetical protein